MAGLQNGRILRFLIAIGAVVLTIFVYASYYSNTSMGMASHLRASSALVSSSSSLSSSSSSVSEKYSVHNLSDLNAIDGIVLGNNTEVDLKDKTMDGSVYYLQDSHSNSRKTNQQKNNATRDNRNTDPAAQKSNEGDSSIFSNSSLNTQDSDAISIPTSNIENLILNADKILKNLTTSPSTNQNIQQEKQQESNNSKALVRSSSSLAKPPSVLIPANRMKTSAVGKGAVDPAQGIPTRDIYESGHLDVNPQLCPDEGEAIKLLIIITSAHAHQDARLSIRQTWGHYGTRRDVAIAFILGRTSNKTLENSLNQENYIYGDLIRGHFVDSYNNLTLKTISALEWVDQNCPQAKFVLKTDDDMFINVPKLMAFLDKHQKDQRVIFGRLAKKWKPIRNKKSKYYVSNGQFAAMIFPPFTTGPAYVMSADIIHDLYKKALQQTYLKLEDVFTTGIVAQQLSIKRIHVNEFLNRRIAFNPCNIRKTISVHMIKSNEQFDLWKKLLDQSTNCK